MKEKRWFEQDKDGIRHVINFLSPYENITTGSSPLDGMMRRTAQKHDIYINVSAIPQYYLDFEKPNLDTKYHWFPLVEDIPWGYQPFFWSKKVLDEHHDKGHNIYLHCEKGINRSPSIAMAWLTSRGHSLEEAAEISAGGRRHLTKSKLEKYKSNISQGFIPQDLDELYQRMGTYGDHLDTLLVIEPPLILKK